MTIGREDTKWPMSVRARRRLTVRRASHSPDICDANQPSLPPALTRIGSAVGRCHLLDAQHCLSSLCAVLYDISQLLQTGLDRETLAVLVGLTESGVNPEALAAVIKELRRETAALRADEAGITPRDAVISAAARLGAEEAAFPTANVRSMVDQAQQPHVRTLQ